MKIIFKTERLVIRELNLNDAENLFRLDSDPEVLKYIDEEPPKSVEGIREGLPFAIRQYEEHGYNRWAIELIEDSSFIGWTGFRLITKERNGYINFPDLGYRLMKPYWGKGYATESALASIRYGFEVLDFETIYAEADINNLGSHKVLLKCGMQLDGSFDDEGYKVNWYSLKKAVWLGAQDS